MTRSMNVSANLSGSELRLDIKEAREQEEQGEYLCCQYLLRIEASRCYLTWGFASVREYADIELGLTPRQVTERLRVARALGPLPALRQALQTGELSFSAVREITRVATRATEADWVRAACGASARNLERLVTASKDGEVPERTGFGLPRNLVTVSFQVTPDQLALLEAARDQLAAETGAHATLAAVVLCSVQERWSTEPAKQKTRVGRRAVPQICYVKCPDCARAAVHTDDGLVPVRDEAIVAVETDAEHHDAPTVGIDHAPTDAELRAFVLARDGHRCRVPGCTSRSAL
ncbi:MAG: DUF222 domain-containing protein, partial [Planctomycetota bacterium]